MTPTLLPGLERQSSALLLERLLVIADDAVIVADAEQRVVVFNESAERCFGHSAAAVLGQPLAMLLPGAVRARHADHIRVFAASPLTSRRMGDRSDLRGQRADGSLFDAEASISHVEIEGRIYFAAILRDVSEARRDERALAASEARFRGLALAVPVGILQTDTQGHCLYVNDRWCEIAGMSADEAAGLGWLRALHPSDRAAVRDGWSRAVGAGQPFTMRYRFLRPDGSESWVIGNAVAHSGAEDRIDGYVGTVTDVTDSHHQALALERAKSEAEAATRAKSMFLANMSHEIRTPLNAVIGMTTLLLDTPMSPDQRDFANTIRSSGEALLEIISDILDYSKSDVGKLELEQHAFDLRRLVEESLDLVAPRALERGLNLAYVIEDGTPEALIGDPARVRQILVNLLSNAVKFTHQGEVFVAVDSERVDSKTQRIQFAVKDTGIGIAAEHLPRLFQSFMQVDASTTRKYGGTGLGLAISRRLAELMGGDVSADSELGHGSVFHATVLTTLAPAAEPAEFLRRNAPALVGKRILIVDDNQTNRRILTKLTLQWGMLPSTLPSALEACDRVRHGEAFDVAVLDMSMPGIDGMDLATEIRRWRRADELPIVMLTSLGQRQAGPLADQLVWLPKPIKAGLLFSTLVAVIDGEGVAATTPEALRPPAAPATKLRILVAEDHSVNQRVVLRLLKHLGYDADLAVDGRMAVNAVRRQPYDLVLMDIQMPELDGVQAAREIVQWRGPSGPPRIIAMTANAMPGDREIYLAAGMDGYLAKPIELDALAAFLVQAGARVRNPARARTAACASESVLDHKRLEHLRSIQDDSQPSLVRELIDQFIAESAAHIEGLREAQSAGDAALLRARAHRFLSLTQNIGATHLSALCAELERMAKLSQLAAVPALVAALADERALMHDALAAARLHY